MNQDSLFKPTPELMQEWLTKWKAKRATVPYDEFFATEAARWGADQELEACVKWISEQDCTWTSSQLRCSCSRQVLEPP